MTRLHPGFLNDNFQPYTTMYRIGIDLGGTKIEGVVLDADGKELIRKRIPKR